MVSNGLAFEDPILGLDPSTKCIGWAVLSGDKAITGHVKFGGELGKRLALYRNWVREIVNQHRPAMVGCEDVMIRHPSAGVLYCYNGVTREALSSYIGLLDFVQNTSWKKEVCGNGKISTKEKEAGRVCEILTAMGYPVDHVDEADALAVALCMRKRILGPLTKV